MGDIGDVGDAGDTAAPRVFSRKSPLAEDAEAADITPAANNDEGVKADDA
jgi:hypothetical protein